MTTMSPKHPPAARRPRTRTRTRTRRLPTPQCGGTPRPPLRVRHHPHARHQHSRYPGPHPDGPRPPPAGHRTALSDRHRARRSGDNDRRPSHRPHPPPRPHPQPHTTRCQPAPRYPSRTSSSRPAPPRKPSSPDSPATSDAPKHPCSPPPPAHPPRPLHPNHEPRLSTTHNTPGQPHPAHRQPPPGISHTLRERGAEGGRRHRALHTRAIPAGAGSGCLPTTAPGGVGTSPARTGSYPAGRTHWGWWAVRLPGSVSVPRGSLGGRTRVPGRVAFPRH